MPVSNISNASPGALPRPPQWRCAPRTRPGRCSDCVVARPPRRPRRQGTLGHSGAGRHSDVVGDGWTAARQARHALGQAAFVVLLGGRPPRHRKGSFSFHQFGISCGGQGALWVWVCKVLDPAPFGATQTTEAWCLSGPMRPLGTPGLPTQRHVKRHSLLCHFTAAVTWGEGSTSDHRGCPREPGTPGTEASVHHCFWHQAPPEILMGGPYLRAGRGGGVQCSLGSLLHSHGNNCMWGLCGSWQGSGRRTAPEDWIRRPTSRS